AEKYINAAWLLQQHGDVGHHMGMIAEKRGKKDDAIRLYAQGTATLRSAPDARESLLRVAPADSVKKLLEVANAELRNYNVLNMGQLMPALKAPAEAEFYVVF